jgi:hypothetical protein
LNKPIVTLQDKTNVLHKLSNYNSEDRRISRENLAAELRMSLRKLRTIVHEINADDTDHLILTDTDNGGYWLATRGDHAPAVRNYYEEESRAVNTIKKVAAMKRKIARIYGAEALDPSVKLQGILL